MGNRRLEFIRFELLVACACLAGLAMFGWHGFLGSRGVGYRQQLAFQAEAVGKQYAALAAVRGELEARVQLVRPETLDPDMAEELVRRNLGLAKPTDLIIKTAE